MVFDERHELLRALDQRYDDAVRQLDELNQRIEQTLVAHGVMPSGTTSSPSPLAEVSGS